MLTLVISVSQPLFKNFQIFSHFFFEKNEQQFLLWCLKKIGQWLFAKWSRRASACDYIRILGTIRCQKALDNFNFFPIFIFEKDEQNFLLWCLKKNRTMTFCKMVSRLWSVPRPKNRWWSLLMQMWLSWQRTKSWTTHSS